MIKKLIRKMNGGDETNPIVVYVLYCICVCLNLSDSSVLTLPVVSQHVTRPTLVCCLLYLRFLWQMCLLFGCSKKLAYIISPTNFIFGDMYMSI